MSYLTVALVEFIGTFIFLSVILQAADHGALAVAVALLAVIYFGVRYSNAHYNPVVSIVEYSSGKIGMELLAVYIIAQILGGLGAVEFQKFLKANK